MCGLFRQSSLSYFILYSILKMQILVTVTELIGCEIDSHAIGCTCHCREPVRTGIWIHRPAKIAFPLSNSIFLFFFFFFRFLYTGCHEWHVMAESDSDFFVPENWMALWHNDVFQKNEILAFSGSSSAFPNRLPVVENLKQYGDERRRRAASEYASMMCSHFFIGKAHPTQTKLDKVACVGLTGGASTRH